jgi:hypothetical protein
VRWLRPRSMGRSQLFGVALRLPPLALLPFYFVLSPLPFCVWRLAFRVSR